MIHFTKAKATPQKPKKPKGGKKATLNKLKNFLYQAEPEAVEILVSNFNAQQNAVTYKELREAYLAGGITQKQFEKWQKDYSQLITVSLAPKWEAAAAAAAQEVKDKYPYFVYEPSVSAGMDFIKQHGAELVTNLAFEQRDALNAIIAHVSGYTAVTPDEAARIIRPVIGLTKPQALANARYRESVKAAYLKANPRCREETANKKAAEAAARYAARQHRYRAQNIARTELAFAYNAGHYGATKDAQAHGYIGDCTKTLLTADDERVCPICGSLDGEKRNLDEPFSFGKLLPPVHPSCRCAVAYEEIPGTNLTPAVDSGTIDVQTPPPKPEYDIEAGTQKLKGAMPEEDYNEYVYRLKNHENPDIKKLYAKYTGRLSSITMSPEPDEGHYSWIIDELVFSYPSQQFIDNGRDKYSILAHEHGHYFDKRCPFKGITFNEIDAIQDAIHSFVRNRFDRVASSSDQFLAAVRQDKELLLDCLRDAKTKRMVRSDGSNGVQDAICGLIPGTGGTYVRWGHLEQYYDDKYSQVENAREQANLQDAYRKLGIDASSLKKAKEECRIYEAASEMWANIMSAETNGGEELAYVKEYLPNSYAAMLKILSDLE